MHLCRKDSQDGPSAGPREPLWWEHGSTKGKITVSLTEASAIHERCMTRFFVERYLGRGF